jgi:glycosyltransferase involved in cell wall biosynthesis
VEGGEDVVKLISCIMPSKNSPEMVERAVASYLNQTYPAREMVMLRPVGDLRELRWKNSWAVPPGLSIGELRNIACRVARGSIIAHWDDDDESSPDRLQRSVDAIDAGADIVGSSRVIFTNGTKRWLYDGECLTPPYLIGGTLVYKRRFWEMAPFEDRDRGEDTRWQHYWRTSFRNPKVADLRDEHLYIAHIHPYNTDPKDTSSRGWSELP